MIDAGRLEEVVLSHTEALCRHFFPEGKKVGHEWRISSSPRPGRKKRGSLAIRLAGLYAGCWRDWATDEHGTFTRLVMTHCNLNFPDAARAIGSAIGVNLETNRV
jgi:hypothetical protein